MKFQDGQTVGIDLGTSSSTIARLDADGQARVIPNSNGDAITPSVILMGHQGQVVVGPGGEWMRHTDPERVIVGIKRQMGNPEFVRDFQGRKLNAEFFSGLILMKLKQDAERRIGPIRNAVITVPYYFNDPCRRATHNAGTIAGLNVVDILNEPTAAVLAYAWVQGDLGHSLAGGKERTILVYDLGGGTFDVTLVKCNATNFRVLATDGDTFLGGLDWTRRLINHTGDRFRQQCRLDPRDDGRSRLALTDVCEIAKRDLSVRRETTIDYTYKDHTLKIPVTRSEFERMTADLLQRTKDTTELVLEGANIQPGELDDIIMVGGSTYMAAVPKVLEQICGKPPSRILDPQLAVAQGAAVHAAILEARERGAKSELSQALRARLGAITSVDVNSHSLGVEITEPEDISRKRNHIMIPRNTALPAEFSQIFATNRANPEGIVIRLLEGDASDPESCTSVGDLRITGLPANLPEGSPVEVTYRYDEKRNIKVEARELVGNNSASVEIHWTTNSDAVPMDGMILLAKQYRVE